jgi:hypothetical protein
MLTSQNGEHGDAEVRDARNALEARSGPLNCKEYILQGVGGVPVTVRLTNTNASVSVRHPKALAPNS